MFMQPELELVGNPILQ